MSIIPLVMAGSPSLFPSQICIPSFHLLYLHQVVMDDNKSFDKKRCFGVGQQLHNIHLKFIFFLIRYLIVRNRLRELDSYSIIGPLFIV